jgi:hypothetical protein
MMNGFVQIARWTSPFKIFSMVRVKNKRFKGSVEIIVTMEMIIFI